MQTEFKFHDVIKLDSQSLTSLNSTCVEGKNHVAIFSYYYNMLLRLTSVVSRQCPFRERLHTIFCGFQTSAAKMVLIGPRPLVLCGPSGSGKSTLLKSLLDEFPLYFGFSVSHTTRKPRPGEENGREYHFVERKQMESAIAKGEFLETAEFSENLYGTSKAAVEDVARTGKICILDIDVQGVKNIKKTDLNPRYIFVKPPSFQILEERLRARNTETEESLQKRLNMAKEEMKYGDSPGNFDIVIVNDTVEKAYQKLRDFIIEDIRVLQGKNKIGN